MSLCGAVALQGSAENRSDSNIYLVPKYYKRLFENSTVTGIILLPVAELPPKEYCLAY